MTDTYWHFVADDKLRGGGIPAAPGETERWNGPLVLCRSGLHASKRALNALELAPCGRTTQVRLVTLGGQVLHDDDKSVASERTIIASADCTRTLYEYALWCAESVRHLMTDARSANALDVRRRWLDGQATDGEMIAAQSAAWCAIEPTDEYATRNAAEAAAAAVTERPAAHVARATAWLAVQAIEARGAQIYTVVKRQYAELERRLHELLGTMAAPAPSA